MFISFDLNLTSFWMIPMFCLNIISIIYLVSVKMILISIIKLEFYSYMNSLKFSNWSKGLMNLNLFFMLLLSLLNYSSVMPFAFSITSQMSILLFISLTLWSMIFFKNLLNNFKNFIAHMIPEGSPLEISMFLFVVEVISSLIRPITLSVRMVANVMAGHILMILLCQMILWVNSSFILYLILICLEFYISIIQAYIFVTLISLYYSEI